MTLEFIIILLLLFLNLVMLIIKSENLVLPAIIIALFTISICAYYAYYSITFGFNIDTLFVGLIITISGLSIWIKGNEKYE